MADTKPQEVHPSFDVRAQRVAHVYADALLNAAEKQGEADRVYEELDSLVSDVFKADPSFESFLVSASIGRKTREEVLRKVFETRASKLFFNFLLVLNQHDRLDLLRTILVVVRNLRDQRGNRRRVQVKSAAPLEDDQRERLTKELHETFKFEPVLETQVDPELIGGIIVRVGDWLYDASVRTQLASLRKQLIESSSHEIQSGRNRFGN